MMHQHTELSYNDLQRWKAEEFQKFFAGSQTIHPYLNHLNEVEWLTETEADNQHEFFDYEESTTFKLKKLLGARPYQATAPRSNLEAQTRLQIRRFLEKQHSGGISTATASQLPAVLEHELSDEDILNVPVYLENIEQVYWDTRFLSAMMTVVVLMAAMAGYAFVNQTETIYGGLLIESNVKSARIYLDESQSGYTQSTIQGLTPGTYKLSLEKPGYFSDPEYRTVTITGDSLTTLFVNMFPKSDQNQGILKISANHIDSKIFIDNDFRGTIEENPYLPLNSGQYSVIIEKHGYSSVPGEQIINVSAGDTMHLAFEQERRSYTKVVRTAKHRNARTTLGISTNIRGAKIFLDGEDTGKYADYVFADLSEGTYNVSLKKEGYKSVPENQDIQLSAGSGGADIDFEMIKTHEKLSIITTPVAGDIFINGKKVGRGKIEQLTEMGQHTVSFGSVEGYKTPRPRVISLSNAREQLNVSYFPEMKLDVEITTNGSVNVDNCDLITGYTFDNRAFSASKEAGPEVVFVEKQNDYFWKFGYAFPYRNPKGSDGVKMSFNLPKVLDHEQSFRLQLEAASSKERYPHRTTKDIDISIKVNGRVISYTYSPKPLENNGLDVMEWDITRFIKPGNNAVEISTTEKNNTFFYVKRIMLTN